MTQDLARLREALETVDRELQATLGTWSGVPVIAQDPMAQESMGEIYDRTQEHLGSSDAMVIRARRRLLDAAHELAEKGVAPYSADHPEVYRQRSGGVILPDGADWTTATQELRKAYVDHPELDPALAGR